MKWKQLKIHPSGFGGAMSVFESEDKDHLLVKWKNNEIKFWSLYRWGRGWVFQLLNQDMTELDAKEWANQHLKDIEPC
jgi:hypothetical protein